MVEMKPCKFYLIDSLHNFVPIKVVNCSYCISKYTVWPTYVAYYSCMMKPIQPVLLYFFTAVTTFHATHGAGYDTNYV